MSFPQRPNPVFGHEYRCLVDVLIGARRGAGLSQRALARELGTSQSHVSKIEVGERRVDALEFYKMARACGAEPAELYARVAARLRALEGATTAPAVCAMPGWAEMGFRRHFAQPGPGSRPAAKPPARSRPGAT